MGLKDDVKFDLCFGGRRQFCDEVYADLGENIHYNNKPMQYTVIFHSCKNDNFQMKNCDIFSSPEPKAHW